MKQDTIYKSQEGRDKLANYYESYLKTIPVEFERVYIPTRFGKTHVLVTGPKEGKPLFIFQGGNCINPVTLSWFSGLLNDYRVYAPDTIGHPGYSDESRISGKDESFSLWVTDLMDYFSVEKAAFIGPSYGGGIVLRLAAYHPEKIACAVLVSPAGIKMGSKLKMIQKILLPLLVYKRKGSAKALKKITDEMSSGSMKEMDRRIIGEIFKNVKLEQDMPKLTTQNELHAYTAPTLLIVGEEDVFFPGEIVIKKAGKIISEITKSCQFNSGHFPSETNKLNMQKEIREFLTVYY